MSRSSANADFAVTLRNLRAARDLSREDLAKKASISRNTLYLIEEVKANVRVVTICKLARALEMHPCAFFEKGTADSPAPNCSCEDLPDVVAQAVTRLRIELELSQNELTKRADLPRGYVGQIERLRPDITLEVLARIATALKSPLSEFFKG
ncbi:helix-turn-helix domain-containing protein [Paraburkholderia pallida]